MNHNLGNVKRLTDGHFSIANTGERERAEVQLCDKCGVQSTCKIKKSLKRQKQIIAPIKMCKVFVPVISFNALDGLDTENSRMFNTIRNGSAWARRLRMGDNVILWDSKNDKQVGKAIVQWTVCGPKPEMLKAHARLNHMSIGKHLDDYPAYIENILKKAFGVNFYNNSDELSVIVLQNT
jgi:hypothetical protein